MKISVKFRYFHKFHVLVATLVLVVTLVRLLLQLWIILVATLVSLVATLDVATLDCNFGRHSFGPP